MRVQLISNLFAPDELAGASLYTDLARFLRDAGHDVRVTTTFSYYPAWQLRPEDKGLTFRDEELDGIAVRRVAMHVPQEPTGKGRLLSDLSFLWALLRHGRFSDWIPDVIITALPMLSQCLVQRFQYPFRRIPRLIIVQDFVVEAALELGILKLPGAAGLLRAVQRWAIRSAEIITTISPLMLRKLDREIGPGRKTAFVPNWIHESLQNEIQRQMNSPASRDMLRLFYSGNLGVKQGLPDFLTQFAEAACSEEGWRLEICGGGAEKTRIEQRASSLSGVSFGPVLDESAYIGRLLTSTACLVTQKPGTGANFLPSKLLPALATATPVLAVCEGSSPLAEEVIQGGFGRVISPGDSEALQACLREWNSTPEILNAYSLNAAKRAQEYHRSKVLPVYEGFVRELVNSRKRK